MLHKLEQFWEGGVAMLGNLGKIMTSKQNLFNRQNWGWVSGGVAEGGVNDLHFDEFFNKSRI